MCCARLRLRAGRCKMLPQRFKRHNICGQPGLVALAMAIPLKVVKLPRGLSLEPSVCHRMNWKENLYTCGHPIHPCWYKHWNTKCLDSVFEGLSAVTRRVWAFVCLWLFFFLYYNTKILSSGTWHQILCLLTSAVERACTHVAAHFPAGPAFKGAIRKGAALNLQWFTLYIFNSESLQY